MSTYGVAVVVDVQDADALADVLAALATLDGRAWLAPVAEPWRRVTAYLSEVEFLDTVVDWVAAAGVARAAVADDYDEFGALWVVLGNDGSGVRTVHRRYVLNADPGDPDDVAAALAEFDGVDPRQDDVAGPDAAGAAAVLFGVDPAAMRAAEATEPYAGIGTIGGPFPWWDALALPWPQDGAGHSLVSSP